MINTKQVLLCHTARVSFSGLADKRGEKLLVSVSKVKLSVGIAYLVVVESGLIGLLVVVNGSGWSIRRSGTVVFKFVLKLRLFIKGLLRPFNRKKILAGSVQKVILRPKLGIFIKEIISHL